MQKESVCIELSLESGESDLTLTIHPEPWSLLFEIDENEAAKFGESPYQLLEGNSYEYKFNKEEYRLKCSYSGIVTVSNQDKSRGRIVPNIYVGTLTMLVYKIGFEEKEYPVYLEVRATKLQDKPDENYRENYIFMLESITRKCTELLMQINSPVMQHFESDFDRADETTTYQRFAFVQSLINSNEFNEAVQKIISSPVTKWKEENELKDIRRFRRFNNSSIRQIASGNNRTPLPENHFLTELYDLCSIPTKILSTRKTETVDTPENRLIKHVLEVFLKFCNDCENIFAERKYIRQQKEAKALIENLESHLNHSLFKDVSRPDTLRLNSPVLQRKSGYREVLNSWLMFDLAAKLIWQGGEKVYNAGKRDIAVLYEYWLFFALYDLFKNKFNLNKHSYDDKPYEHLIEPTKDGLNVMLKSGKQTALEGIYETGKRKLYIKFSYNRSYPGGKKYGWKFANSWTKAMRPDYSLSIWLNGLSEKEAEEKEMIVHIHFDAKYKVTQFLVEVDIKKTDDPNEDSLDIEKTEERKGIYKNADLLKMHAYKDAIRRTGGAYVLYPGTVIQDPFRGFHEIIPGLGAFAIRPSEDNSGIEELSKFIDNVLKHFSDRASQREKISSKTYDVYKNEKDDNLILDKSMPEYFGDVKMIPDDTYVLVAYYKSDEHLKWIEKNKMYNVRTGDARGSVKLTSKEVGARYVLIYGDDENVSNRLFKLVSGGPEFYTKENILEKGYPEPKNNYYFVFKFEDELDSEFKDLKWDIKEIVSQFGFNNLGFPFCITLTELMNNIV